MEPHRILHRRLIAEALLGDHVEQHRPLHLQYVFQGRQEVLEVVAVDRTGVLETQFLEQEAGKNRPLRQLLSPAGDLLDFEADVGNLAQ